MALVDAGGHEVRAQHRRADLVGHQRKVLVQRFAEAHHRMLADVVDAHVRRADQPGHRRGVDDVAFVAGVGRGGFQHARREHAHAMRHTHHVDAQHPFPVGRSVLPDQAAVADARVVEHQVRHAEAGEHRGAERLDLGGTRHVQAKRQHGRTQRGHLGRRALQRIGLHVGHHHVHAFGARPGAPSRDRSRAGAGDHGRAALQSLHGVLAAGGAGTGEAGRSISTCGMPSSM